MALGFAAHVDQWTKQSQRRMLAVFKRAVELLADELRVAPWVTGNMVRSLQGQLNTIVQTAENAPAGDVGAAVAMAQIGDFISLGFQAAYARRRNYGFVGQDSLGRNYNEAGAHFVERAAGMWPSCVAKAAAEIQSQAVA